MLPMHVAMMMMVVTVIMVVMVMMIVMVIVVIMVVVMLINRHHRRHVLPEQMGKFRVARHRLRGAGTANMMIKADDLPGRGHDHMQIMAHHQNRQAAGLMKAVKGFVELHLA